MTDIPTIPGFDLDAYIDQLQWSDEATQHEKSLVIGNLSTLCHRIATLLAQQSAERAEMKRDMLTYFLERGIQQMQALAPSAGPDLRWLLGWLLSNSTISPKRADEIMELFAKPEIACTCPSDSTLIDESCRMHGGWPDASAHFRSPTNLRYARVFCPGDINHDPWYWTETDRDGHDLPGAEVRGPFTYADEAGRDARAWIVSAVTGSNSAPA